MRRGFGQYSADSGLDTSGVSMGSGGAAPGDVITQQLNLLPFGGSAIAGETPIQGGVACTGPGCSSVTSSANSAAPQSNTLLIVILALAAVAGMFIAGGRH
jgi:Zn-dependent protease